MTIARSATSRTPSRLALGGARLLHGARAAYAFGLAALAAVSAISCGASINAVYEGDVRFEHCMALDSRPDMKPTIRRACWQEWARFYTFGQTRDRVDYARQREAQLRSASDFDEAEWTPPSRNTSAAPEPTSVLAPPPITLSVEPTAPRGVAPPPVSAGADARPPPGAECASGCDESWAFCREECTTPACEKSCTTRYKRCMRKCF